MLPTNALPRAATVLFGIGIILELLSAGTLFYPRQATQASSIRAERRAPINPPLNVNAIVQGHLFGVAPAQALGDADTPVSSQNLQLTATFATNDPARGYAILGDAGQPTRVHSTGEALTGGARLDRVFTDYVILDRGGSMEKLFLRTRAAAADGAGEMPHAKASSSAVRAVPAEPAADTDENSNAPVKMAAFQLLPVFGARDSGARIGLIKNPEQFGKTGLTAGDIVTAVNGMPVHDVLSAANLLRASGGRQLTLTVKRGAQIEDIQVESLD